MRRLAVIIGVVAAAPAAAAPSEPPPADYARDEYVDGAGCAFQRVEIGEDIVWAARSHADGTPLCGLAPSLAAGSDADALPAIAPHRRGQAPQFPAPGRYVQIAAFRRPEDADAVVAAFRSQGLPLLRQDFRGGRSPFRLLYAGPFASDAAASRARAQIREKGFLDAFIWTQD